MEQFDTYELIETLKKHRLLICQYRWEVSAKSNERESYLADVEKTIFEVFEKDIPARERYIMRKERAGEVYDKLAMEIVSKNLGHNRISVIAQSYLYN